MTTITRKSGAGAVRVGTVFAVLAASVTACSTPGTSTTSDGHSSHGHAGLVLADGYEPDSLHPLLGYGIEGASKIFDGLVEHDAQRRLQPALARELPQPDADARSWTVRLRDGVTFHDGSSLDAADVVATYRALLDPATASTETTSYTMISAVHEVDPMTVRFDLTHPYAAFPHRLTLGVLPSESLAEPGPAVASPLNTQPIGTGPYRVVEWRKGERLMLEANESYWDGAPEIPRITVVFAADDNTRAQRMSTGEFDGTVLPPGLAHTFDSREGFRVISHRSADYRTVMLPTNNPVTGDPAVRLALNHAVNRQGMIDALLSGEGEPAYTPISPAMTDYAHPSAGFDHDPARAGRILDQAGWVRDPANPDGIRQRDGRPARFTLLYPAADTVRKDLAQAFASDARKIGIDVRLEGLGWEAIQPRMGRDALVLGGGSPLDPDLVSYPLLHSSFAADGFNNPGSYANAEVDAALEAGRRALDPAVRAEAYREFQRAYVADPGMVFLVFLRHTYVLRDGDRFAGYQEVVEPHAHGTGWGPWWNVEDWDARS